MTRGGELDGFGMYAREIEIMDLIDAGVPRHEVARRLGVAQIYIERVATLFNNDTIFREADRFEDMCRTGSAALERAILATGRRHA